MKLVSYQSNLFLIVLLSRIYFSFSRARVTWRRFQSLKYSTTLPAYLYMIFFKISFTSNKTAKGNHALQLSRCPQFGLKLSSNRVKLIPSNLKIYVRSLLLLFYQVLYFYLFIYLQIRVVQYSIISVKNRLSKGGNQDENKINQFFLLW